LSDAPGIALLITSRERLNLSSETVFNVSGMRVPQLGTVENVLNYSAAKLFVQAARRIRPNLAFSGENVLHLRRICRLVGGMPLALVMAADNEVLIKVHATTIEAADALFRQDYSPVP
jgi:predicted ATPase